MTALAMPQSPRLHGMFTGQWADVPRKDLFRWMKTWGYTSVELACWGDHFNVHEATHPETGEAYIAKLKAELAENGLVCVSISAHLVGQATTDNTDGRHALILSKELYGDGAVEGVQNRAVAEMIKTAHAAKALGVSIVNGFTGSPIWHLLYAFPPTSQALIDEGYAKFAKIWIPILDVFKELGIRFALEAHPTEIAFDIVTAHRTLKALDYHPAFGFNYDPSHFGYQGVDYIQFIYEFHDRIFHVHMKDVAWGLTGRSGVFGGHVEFHTPDRHWDFRSLGRGHIKFEEIIRALNDIGYTGELSVEWEDGRMHRYFGAAESRQYLLKLDFPRSDVIFDAQFAEAAK